MKRLVASVIILLALTALSLSCEKDDLCAEGTPTTPSVIIEFYDRENGDDLVEVINFKYYAVGVNDTLPVVAENQVTKFSRIELPLRADATTTTWALIYNRPLSNGVYAQNTDFLEFNYTTNQVYVSRACGFKTTYTLNDDDAENPGVVNSDADPADGIWIDHFDIETNNIEDENETHIKIFI